MNSVTPVPNRKQRPATLWGHLQRELIFLNWALMEVALLTPFVLSFIPWAYPWPAGLVFLWLLFTMLLSFNLVRLMSSLWLSAENQRNVMAVGLVLFFLFSLPMLLYQSDGLEDLGWLSRFIGDIGDGASQNWRRGFSVFLLTTLMWWRGIRLSNQALTLGRAGLRLRLGGLMLAPIMIWASFHLLWNVTPFLLLFFFAGLMAVILARAEEIERDRSGRSASMGPRWLSAITAGSLLVIISAAVLASLLSGNAIPAIVGWLVPLWSALRVAATIIGNTVAYLIQPLFLLLAVLIEWLIGILRVLFASVMSEGFEVPTFEFPLQQATPETGANIERGFDAGQAIVLLLMIALVLVVALTLARRYRQAALAAGEHGTGQGSGEERPERGAGLGQRLGQRLSQLRQWRAAASVRRIYREMCSAAAATGYPRTESETPYEYRVTLEKVWPDGSADTMRITQAYVRVRYGEIPETRGELEEIRLAWLRLKHTQPPELRESMVRESRR